MFPQTGLSFDLSTSTGKLMRAIMSGLAEFERDLIRERVKTGMATAKVKGTRSGKPIGRPSGRSFRTTIQDRPGADPARRRPEHPLDRQASAHQPHDRADADEGGRA